MKKLTAFDVLETGESEEILEGLGQAGMGWLIGHRCSTLQQGMGLCRQPDGTREMTLASPGRPQLDEHLNAAEPDTPLT